MAKISAEIDYEKDEDILSFWRGKPSISSIEIGDFIIDVDKEGYIVGLEILNASENFEIDSEILSNLKHASMSVLYKPGYVYILLKVQLKNKDKEISIPLTVDLGHKSIEKEKIIFQ